MTDIDVTLIAGLLHRSGSAAPVLTAGHANTSAEWTKGAVLKVISLQNALGPGKSWTDDTSVARYSQRTRRTAKQRAAASCLTTATAGGRVVRLGRPPR